MLTTQQKSLRKFWYATVRIDALAAGAVPFRLMGEDIVLFLDAKGEPTALADRCCHRTAKLSKGWMDEGQIVCGYHGWTYDSTGTVTRIPQLAPGATLPHHTVPAYRCAARYGYAWVALDEPAQPIPDVPEDGADGWRRIFQFYDQWQTAPLRLMENSFDNAHFSFDNAHFSFVHRGTFGDIKAPQAKKYEIVETEYGFEATTVVDILNPPAAHAVTGSTEPMTERHMRNQWYLPFARRLDIGYPSGIRHIIINCATPIDDDRIQLVQLLYRNDTEADCSTQALIAWDRTIVMEDRDALESTSPDAILDVSRRIEQHMPSDRPGLIMRRRLLEFLRSQGEEEITRKYA